MPKVWLVTSGAYSDYHIVAAFATKELADAYAAHVPGDYGQGIADVEEWELRTSLPSLLTVHHRECRVLADGTIHEQEPWIEHGWPNEIDAPPCRARLDPRASRDYGDEQSAHVKVGVIGTDETRVAKVYTEAKASALTEVLILLGEAASGESNAPVNWDRAHELASLLT